MSVELDDIVLELIDVSLTLHQRSRTFQRISYEILREISFAIPSGHTLGVIGKNGSGKSTLLKLIAGIIYPSAGAVRIGSGLRASLMTLGLGFRVDLSGRDNSLVNLMLHGHSRRDALDCLNGIQEYAGIGDYFDQPVRTYSSGMRSRLGFATALAADVDILLIDEILSVGDAEFRQKAEESMGDKLKGDKTVVLVSHAIPQVKRLCDSVLYLESGCILAHGDADEICDLYLRESTLGKLGK